MGTNLFTLYVGEQPTAYQSITGDYFFIGTLTDTPGYWAALISGIGIAICFVCTLMRKNIVVCITAILADVALGIAYFATKEAPLSRMRALDGDGFGIMSIIGWGYIGIFLLLLLACFTCFSKGSPIGSPTG
jgi:hypothetical protein